MPKAPVSRVTLKSSGQPNTAEIVKQGRLKDYENPFDPLPNVQRGHTLDHLTGMRVGLSPEIFLGMVEVDLENTDRKRSIPRLTREELDIVKKSKLSQEAKDKIAAYIKKCFNFDL